MSGNPQPYDFNEAREAIRRSRDRYLENHPDAKAEE